MVGVVVKSTGSWYTVKSEAGECFECKVKGNFRLKGIRSTNPVAVGDFVDFEKQEDGTGLIVRLHERKNYIIRRASNLSKQSHILAANLDLLVLVVTVNYPETYTVFIDRVLATSEAYGVPTCIVINKVDLYDEYEMGYAESVKFLYENINYPVFLVSALQPETMDALKEFLKDKVSLISGNSGVGKSTIIRELIPGLDIKISDISEFHNRGMHTTTFSEMFELPDGGSLIDTPGIKGFGTLDMDLYEIGHFFKEIFYFSKKCRFNDCTHRNEPDCAVLKAVDEHYISHSRYQSYLSIIEENQNEKYR